MPEPLKANLTPINMLAKKQLNQLGQGSDPSYLYALQLEAWALESNILELSGQGQYLPYTVGRLHLADQEKLGLTVSNAISPAECCELVDKLIVY